MRVALLAYDDFTDIDLFLAWDLLCRVPALDVRLVAPAPSIRSSTGIQIEVPGGLDEVGRADGVYVTSGKGSRALVRDPAILAALAIDPARQIVAAIDSGTLILAALGLLRGKRATTYPSPDLYAALAAYGVHHVAESLVIEGNLATAAQCLAGVDLVAWLVTRLVGEEAARAAIASVWPLGTPPPRIPAVAAVALERVALSDADAEPLILALNAELSSRYPEEGANHFRLDPDEVAPGRGAFFVARIGGQPAGCGAVRLLDPATAEIKRMYTRPDRRGRGLARQILAALERVAGELGARRLVLETGVRQPEAIALYERQGFTRIGAFGAYTESPLSVFMAKDLRA